MTVRFKSRAAKTARFFLFGLSLLGTHAHAADRPAQDRGIGVYEGNGPTGLARIAPFKAWYGAPPAGILDFLDFSSWKALGDDAGWSIPSWKGYKLIESVPLTAKGTAMSEVARGDHDAVYARIGALLVANDQQDAIVRIGWEANGGWYPWAAAGHAQDYKKAFQHVVTVMRAVPGNHFRFDWCVAQGWQQIVQPEFYPGDDYVDIIGEDIYAQAWPGPVLWPVVQFSLNRNYTLDWLPVFAAAHHKPISIPEWGTGERPDGHGLGDSAAFVQYMAAWIKDHHVLYNNYWDYAAPDYNAKVSDGRHPAAGAALKAAFNQGR